MNISNKIVKSNFFNDFSPKLESKQNELKTMRETMCLLDDKDKYKKSE